MQRYIAFKLFICELMRCLKKHWAAILVCIIIAVFVSDGIAVERTCVNVNFTSFRTVESDTGTSLIAMFDFDGRFGRVSVPRNIIKKKGIHKIYQTKTYIFGREGFQFPIYGECGS